MATADTFTDVLNRELTGVTGNSYADWSGKTSYSDAVYAGQSAGGNESIQLRSNGNNSGVVTTASGGTVKKIIVTWNESTQSGRTLNVYGKNSAYSAATDLYNTSTQGELLGTIVCGTSTELVITDEYAFIGFRSAGSAMYLTEVDIVWETSGSTPPPPTTYTVTYDCNGGTSGCPSNLTNVAKGTVIQLADAPLKDGFTFSGWSDGTNTYEEGEDYTVNSNITFTAQWTESGEYSWVETSLADLTDDDVFVIVGNNGSNYAMSNDKGASSAPAAIAVTIENKVLTSTVSANIQWTLSVSDDGYIFYPNGSTETWLYCISNNNGLRVGTGENETFSIKDNYLYNNGQSRYIGIYNSQVWRSYTSINNNIKDQSFAFYKKVASGDVDTRIATTVTIEKVFIGSYNIQDDEFAPGEVVGQLKAIVKANGNELSGAIVTWESSDPTVATINSNGEIVLVKAGTTMFTASYAGDDQYQPSISNPYSFTVVDEDPNAPGTVNNPYTVAQARSAIDAGTGVTGVYAKGIVSKIVTPFNSQFGNITYNISEDGTESAELQAYRGFDKDGAWFTSADDVQVGDEVIIFGNLKKHNDTYEFDANNQRYWYNRPDNLVSAPVFNPEGGIFTEAQTVTITCATEGADIYYIKSFNDPDTKYTGPIAINETTHLKAIAKKGDVASVATEADYVIVDAYGHGTTAEDAFTVNEAITFIEGLSKYTTPMDVYVSGIVSQVDSYGNGNITYWISDDGETTKQMEVYRGYGLNGEQFKSVDDLQVGDEVTVCGKVKMYNTTPEFDANSKLVAFNRPVTAKPTLTLNPTTIEVGAEGGKGTIIVTMENLVGETLTIESDCDWAFMELNNGNIDYEVEANESEEARTATFTVTAGTADPVTVTINQAGKEPGEPGTDVLTVEKTGATNSTYIEWSGVTCNTKAVYAGKSAKGNDAIQLNSNNKQGIVTTATGGDVKSVTVVWNSNTAADRTLNVYGKATAYESTADLYNKSTQGTLLGSITIGEDQPTTLTIDGSYQFIGLRSASGAMYLDKITIVWDTEAVPQPSISVSPATIEVPAEGGEGTITMTTANLGDESLTITGGDTWATLVVDGDDKLKYTVQPNKGDERTATFTIKAGEASATVKIIQAAYVAPTVATLPFEFNGGRADIEGTDGLTMDGIDSDYAAPTTKLKFNTTGDWLLLTFDEEPGLLFFDIKGNSFGTGTFSVQVSEDGEEFADLSTFGSDEIEGSTLLANQGFALGSGVRYVKWIYTEKNGGNVGLGNIRLQTPNATAQFEVTSAGWATHVTSYPVEFTEEVAYVVTAVSKTGARYQKVSSVPAGTPILVKGEGTWNGTIVLSAEAPETNLLKASDGTVKGNGKIYALANGANGVGFYKVSSAEDAEPIPAGKCYLEIEDEGGEAREFIAIGDDATSVQSVAASLQQAGQLFDLQGRQVQQPTKGLYIQNGKKIVVR